MAQHLDDLDVLLAGWGHERVVLVGHSYGCDLAVRSCLRHPDPLAGLVLLAGPFVGSWREADAATRGRRMTGEQRARMAALEAVPARSDAEEQELLTLAWFPDHDDQQRAWGWASAAARTPVNWDMNRQISRDRRARPLEADLDELAAVLPTVTVLIGGAGDPRPASALERLGRLIGRPTVIIPGAGHEPWLEAPELVRRELRTALHRAVTLR